MRILKEAGAESDESWCFGQQKQFPDLVLEIALSSGGLDKLEIYCRFAVSEVWLWRKGGLESGPCVGTAPLTMDRPKRAGCSLLWRWVRLPAVWRWRPGGTHGAPSARSCGSSSAEIPERAGGMTNDEAEGNPTDNWLKPR